MNDPIRFPPLYRVVRVDRTSSARRHAETLAAEGAEEGTLVLAGGQTEGLGRSGKYWMSGFRNLHLALVLQPDDPLPVACQLSLVTAVSVAMAISRQAEPMAELGYRWPNDVLLNGGKVAGINLTGQLAENGIDWMVISVNVNVHEAPSTEGFAASSMREEGFAKHDRDQLAVAFSQEFLSLANRWAGDGFEPVRKAWMTRRVDEPDLAIAVGERTHSGRFADLDGEGSLLLEEDDGSRRLVTLADFFAPEFRPAGPR